MQVRVLPGRPLKYPTPADYAKAIHAVIDKSLKYLYFMDREHPLADKKGRVWYHRHVASVTLGRWLTAGEVAHHRDENRQNNAAENIEVKERAEHLAVHALERKRLPAYVSCGYCGQPAEVQSHRTRFCSPQCSQLSRRRFVVSEQELRALVADEPLTAIARRFGVSDVAVAKRCRKLGVL